MDFENPNVYCDTSTTDGLVCLCLLANLFENAIHDFSGIFLHQGDDLAASNTSSVCTSYTCCYTSEHLCIFKCIIIAVIVMKCIIIAAIVIKKIIIIVSFHSSTRHTCMRCLCTHLLHHHHQQQQEK